MDDQDFFVDIDDLLREIDELESDDYVQSGRARTGSSEKTAGREKTAQNAHRRASSGGKKRKRKRKGQKKVFLIAAVSVACLTGLILFLNRHQHVPGPEATCTEPQICQECQKVLVEATGHTPGAEATCTEPQVCTVCGEVLAEATGHTPTAEASCLQPLTCSVCGEEYEPALNHKVDDSGVCSMCGEQILPEGQTVHMAGAGDLTGDSTEGLITENTSGGHYNASGDGYYQNSVMICGDYGLEYSCPSGDPLTSWADAVNAFAEKYPDIHTSAMLVPKCCAYHTASNYTDPHDQISQMIQSTYGLLDSSITAVDVMSEFDEHSDEYLFYRTDHHWTSLGAYYASDAYTKANGLSGYSLDTYETLTKTGFVGTLYTYGNKDSSLLTNPDYTVFHFPHTAYTFSYFYNNSWHDASAFNTSTSNYANAFICGDQSVELFNTEINNGKTLMIFKESYGNAFVPYMIDYYSQIIVVDIRQTDLSVANLISQYNVTDVLFINNQQGAGSLSDKIASRSMS